MVVFSVRQRFIPAFLVALLVLVLLVPFMTSRETARADDDEPYWKQVTVDTDKRLRDVFALDSDHVWAVGDKGTVLFFNGTVWSEPLGWHETADLYTVVAFSENDVWILGDKVKAHGDGEGWSVMPIDECVTSACVVPDKPRGKDHSGPYEAWACTDKGNYYTYYDSDWHYEAVGQKKKYAITANCECTAWAGGEDVRIDRWKGGWRTVHFGTFLHKGVQGISVCRNQSLKYRHHVLAVGETNQCFHTTNGILFKKNPTGENKQKLRDVDYLDESHAWAVGNSGTIVFSSDIPVKWDDPIQAGKKDLYAIDALDSTHAWAVGDKGTVLEYSPQPRIIGCSVDNQSSTEVLKGGTYDVQVTGSDTHFAQEGSIADFGDGIEIMSMTVQDKTHVACHINVKHSAATGPRDVNVSTTSGSFSENPQPLADGITVVDELPAPVIHELEPDHGKTGTAVTVRGENFGPSKARSSLVTFNGVDANQYSAWHDNEIVCEVPSGATSGSLWVTTPSGDSNPRFFTVEEPQVPQINFCYPTSVVQGSQGQQVEIHGKYTHFKRGESVAMFDPPDGITVNSTAVIDSRLAVANIDVAGDAALGNRSITVKTGTEIPEDLKDCFTINPPIITMPRLDSLSTDRGSAGDPVTLGGQYFGSTRGSSYVSFNGVAATDYGSWSDTGITCAVPTAATSGPVKVTTSDGTSGGIPFTVGSPCIRACDPTEVVQGHVIDQFHVLGDYTHFEQGKSATVVSGDGITVGSTDVSDSTHATSSLEVEADAPAGTRDVNVVTGAEHPTPLRNVLTVHAAPSTDPELYSLAPGSGPVGSLVFLKGANLGAARGSSQVSFNGTPVTTYLYWSDCELACRVPYGATDGMVEVETPWGTSNKLHFGVSNPSFYFAEGTTRPEFDPYLCVQNPGSRNADVEVTYMKGDGTSQEQRLTVTPQTRSTITVEDILGEGNDTAHDFSARVESVDGEQIIVERPMYFDYGGRWTGGSDAMGALVPTEYFFFAEGTCRSEFQPYLTIQNPGTGVAQIRITYMRGDETTAEQTLEVGPTSRATVDPRKVIDDADVDSSDFSAVVQCTNGERIIAERPMYFDYQGDRPGGHDVVGARFPAQSFYFAEGTTRPGFDPYLCIQNPCQSEASVVITYMRGDGTNLEQSVKVPARSRSTVDVKAFLGEGSDPAYDFSCKVECTNNLWIVAERPMYFDYQGEWPGGHDVVGALSVAQAFYFAEGTCRPGFDTYLCIQNPQLAHANVRITYMRGDGTTAAREVVVPAQSRLTIVAEETIGKANDAAHDFSARVEAIDGVEIVCERPIYFDYHGDRKGGHDVVGFAP